MSRYLRLMPLSMVMGGIYFLSHQPGPSLMLPQLPGLDKVVHGVVYAILAATVLFALPPGLRQRRAGAIALGTVLFCLFYGMTDEFHQSFIPGREPSIGDLAADTAGAVLLAGGWYLYGHSKPRAGAA